MNATVSPVRLMSPSAMRFGVWHTLTARRAGAVSVAQFPQGQADDWQVEWHLTRPLPVPLSVLSRWWWMASVLGLMATLMSLPSSSWSASGHALQLVGALAASSLITRWMLRVYGHHAEDHDHIAMRADRVHVACRRGGRMQSLDCHPRWLRVEPVQHDRSLLRVSGEGGSVVVGEFVPSDGRKQLANELRWALRHLDD